MECFWNARRKQKQCHFWVLILNKNEGSCSSSSSCISLKPNQPILKRLYFVRPAQPTPHHHQYNLTHSTSLSISSALTTRITQLIRIPLSLSLLPTKKKKKKSRVCLSLSPLSLSFSLRIVFFWTFGKVSEWVLWVVGRAVGDWKERTVKEIPQSYEKRANERDRKNRVAALKWLLQFHVLEGNIVFCFFFFLHFFSAMLLPKLLCFIILSSAFLCLSYEPRNPEGNIINLQLLV